MIDGPDGQGPVVEEESESGLDQKIAAIEAVISEHRKNPVINAQFDQAVADRAIRDAIASKSDEDLLYTIAHSKGLAAIQPEKYAAYVKEYEKRQMGKGRQNVETPDQSK